MERMVFDVAFVGDFDMWGIITVLTILFICVVIFMELWNSDHERKAFAFVMFLTGLVLLMFSGIPHHYVVDTQVLTIERPGLDVVIPLEDIVSIARVGNDRLKGIRREGFVTDLGVVKVGAFQNSRLGRFRAYMTCDRNLVFLKTESQAYLLSPLRPEEFMDALRVSEINN